MAAAWAPIDDWTAFLRGSAFWVWYYCNNIGVDEDSDEDPIEVLREIVGPESPDDLNRLLGPGNAMGDSTPGSVLDLPFPGGFTWRLQFHGEPGVCHFLCHPDFADPVCLGWDGPHPRLPVLPWREARRIVVDLADWWPSGPAPVPECFILPLFMPMITWRSGDQGEVRDLLRAAWVRSGMLTVDRVDGIVDRLTRFPGDGDGNDAPASTGGVPAVADPIKRLLAAIETRPSRHVHE